MKILAIGNSFSQDATKYLQTVAKSAGADLFVRNCYIGGCSLERHVKCILTGEAAYEYQIDAVVSEMISIEEALKREEWDYITLQQCSGFSGLPESYEPYISQLVEYVRKCAPKAKIYVHQTWAYEAGSDKLLKTAKSRRSMPNKDNEMMTSQIRALVEKWKV